MKLSQEQIALIAQRIDLADSKYIALLDVGGRNDIPAPEYNSNVYCVDEGNRIVWQISSPSPKISRDSFVDIGLENGILRANRFFGGEYVVNMLTGVAEETGWHK